METIQSIRLNQLRSKIGDCKLCKLHQTRKNIVFGHGEFEKKILAIAQCPGESEDEKGLPLIGKSGELFNKWLSYSGIDREQDVYVSNLILCRPPQNRDPEEDEIKSCSPFLEERIKILKPKVIITFGKFSSQFLSGKNEPISKLRFFNNLKYQDIPLICTLHPSFVLRKEGNFDPMGEENSKVLIDIGKVFEFI